MGIERISEFWPDWQIGDLIGEGSYGKVYKATRTDRFLSTEAAIKVISIPRSNAELEALRSEGMTVDESKSYLEGVVYDFVNEIKLMETLKNTPNIVSVEDYKIIEKKEGVGWDIFIRMELLQSFRNYCETNTISERDVIKLGVDIASALELCEKNNIIHRDIKPANIFISKNGDYKLGDFGVAKELSKTSGAMSSKGTYTYMAPEVAHGMKYDSTVDIYSLGIVMYTLLNNNRLPFTDPSAPQVTYNDRLEANERRLAGEALPAPLNASPMLKDVILFACRYDPQKRFRSASAFKTALLACLNAAPKNAAATAVKPVIPEKKEDLDVTVAVKHKAMQTNLSPEKKETPVRVVRFAEAKKEKKRMSKGKIALLVILSLLAVVLIWCAFNTDTIIEAAENVIEYIENRPTDREYKRAISLMDEGKYEEAAEIFLELDGYLASESKRDKCLDEMQEEKEKEQLRTLSSSDYSLGDTLEFGFYEQDGNKDNGKEAIEWIVLEDGKDGLTLISKYALDVQAYDSYRSEPYWLVSDIYYWLNDEFYRNSFSKDMRQKVLTDDDGTSISLLSSDELLNYTGFLDTRCQPTAYAVDSGCYLPDGMYCYWWLQDSGVSECTVKTVDYKGEVEHTGRYIDEDMFGVRPVITISY